MSHKQCKTYQKHHYKNKHQKLQKEPALNIQKISHSELKGQEVKWTNPKLNTGKFAQASKMGIKIKYSFLTNMRKMSILEKLLFGIRCFASISFSLQSNQGFGGQSFFLSALQLYDAHTNKTCLTDSLRVPQLQHSCDKPL